MKDDNSSILATVIHISDLHFGQRFTTDETLFREILANIPFLKGVYTHSYQAARALSIRINQILADRKRSNIPSVVAMTGDLTRGGDQDEFLIGTTFLRGETWTGAGKAVGLKLGEDRPEIDQETNPALLIIPGNHDIWKRKQPEHLAAYFDHFPGKYPKSWKITTKGRPIVLHGLDSTQTADFKNKLARGYVNPERLNALCKEIELSRIIDEYKDAIHIVMLHHPLIKEGDKSEITMVLDDRETVAQRLYSCGVDLVLAGHFHREYYASEKPGMPNHALAGTATQLFSDRNFLLFDIYKDKIQLKMFEYCKKTLEFIPIKKKERTFVISEPPGKKFEKDSNELSRLINSIKRDAANL
jgi:3',5'-cyclic AMP phosphodiesterase CpdA